MSQVNINNLRSFLTKIVATQVKTTVPAYTNKFAVVNAVTSTSSMMNINPKTGTTTVTTETGTVVFNQPVINPLPINTTTAFVSTNNNQVAVTSKGDEDTIITSKILTVSSLTQLNTGSNTLNNSIDNINNNITTDFWNPQLNVNQLIDGYTSYPSILKYTFTGSGQNIYKFNIKNRANNTYTFPGFSNIKIYQTNNISNYVNITPSLDTNNQYVNETVTLLLKDDDTPYFKDTNQLTLEINMNTFVAPDISSYQFGPNSGIIYTKILDEGKYQTAVTSGGYIYRSSDYGLNWTAITTYTKNWSSVAVSDNGQYQTAVTNGEYIYISSDYGVTWTQIVAQGTNNWKGISMSDGGQYQYAVANSYVYNSTNFGATWNSILTSPVKNWSSIACSSDGTIVYGVTSNEYRYISKDSGSSWTQNTLTWILNQDGSYSNIYDPQNWSSVSCNGQGGFAAYTINGKSIFTSKNQNDSVYQKSGLVSNWNSINCSSTAKYISVCSSNEHIYTSNNFGESFTQSNSDSLNWSSIAVSKGYLSTNSVVSLRAGDYISYNEATGTIDKWSTPIFANNYSSMTGSTIYENKLYMGSKNGRIQVIGNPNIKGSLYSLDFGETWNKQVGSEAGTDDMCISDNGQYSLYVRNEIPGTAVTNTNIYLSDNFCQSRTFSYVDTLNTWKYNCAMSGNGKYQFFINENNFLYYSTNYGYPYDSLTNSPIIFPLGTNGTPIYVDSYVNNNGNITIFYNDDTRGLFVTSSASSGYSSWTQYNLYNYTKIYKATCNKNPNTSLFGNYITLVCSLYDIYAILITYNNGVLNFDGPFSWFDFWGGIGNAGVCISQDGQYQVATWTFKQYNAPVVPNVVYYSNNYGLSWTKNSSNYYCNVQVSKQPILASDDFNYITICGGFSFGNVSNGEYNYTKPCSYVSYNKGQMFELNSTINPATQLQVVAFYYPTFQTNKTYFQVKDLNQTQVLGVSDNGFKMTKDLRVTNANAYVLGGTMTVGPDEISALLNNYTFNVDGTVSCRNVVTLSDKRFKQIVDNVSDKETYDKLDNIDIIKFKYTDRNDNRIYAGMIAQDVYDVFNDAVDIRNSTYMNDEGTLEIPDVYSIRYNVIISYLISAFKGAKKEIKMLKEELNVMKNMINK